MGYVWSVEMQQPALHNNLLCMFDFTDIALHRMPQIGVTFNSNTNNTINVTVQKNIKNFMVKNENGHLSQTYVEKMVAATEKYWAQDYEIRKKIVAKSAFEDCFLRA